jgi:hypothetical protein
MSAPRARRYVCGLCGRVAVSIDPPGVELPPERKLCPECLRLPPPPRAPAGDADADDEGDIATSS